METPGGLEEGMKRTMGNNKSKKERIIVKLLFFLKHPKRNLLESL